MTDATVDKGAIVSALIERLLADMERNQAGQRATQEGATHAEAKSESDKDTRAIEAQYLARGLGMRVEEQREDLARLKAMPLRAFGDDDRVALSALVQLEDEDGAPDSGYYFIVPVGGGLRVEVAGVSVVAITPSSPVGQALVGRAVDDEVQIRSPSGLRDATVRSVS